MPNTGEDAFNVDEQIIKIGFELVEQRIGIGFFVYQDVAIGIQNAGLEFPGV